MSAPVRNRSRRRRPARRPRWSTSATVVTVLVVVTVVKLAVAYLAVTVSVLGVAAVALAVFLSRRVRGRRRLTVRAGRRLVAADPMRMDPNEFEEFLAQLCRRDGCRDVRVVGGAGDLAADVLYTDPWGARRLIQAKRYQPSNRVGSPAIQCVNGTYRAAHGCAHAAVVTTSGFTADAVEFATRPTVRIALLDGQRLNAWAGGNTAAAPWN